MGEKWFDEMLRNFNRKIYVEYLSFKKPYEGICGRLRGWTFSGYTKVSCRYGVDKYLVSVCLCAMDAFLSERESGGCLFFS